MSFHSSWQKVNMRDCSRYSSRHFISYFISSSYSLRLWFSCRAWASCYGTCCKFVRDCACFCCFCHNLASIDSMYAIYSAYEFAGVDAPVLMLPDYTFFAGRGDFFITPLVLPALLMFSLSYSRCRYLGLDYRRVDMRLGEASRHLLALSLREVQASLVGSCDSLWLTTRMLRMVRSGGARLLLRYECMNWKIIKIWDHHYSQISLCSGAGSGLTPGQGLITNNSQWLCISWNCCTICSGDPEHSEYLGLGFSMPGAALNGDRIRSTLLSMENFRLSSRLRDECAKLYQLQLIQQFLLFPLALPSMPPSFSPSPSLSWMQQLIIYSQASKMCFFCLAKSEGLLPAASIRFISGVQQRFFRLASATTDFATTGCYFFSFWTLFLTTCRSEAPGYGVFLTSLAIFFLASGSSPAFLIPLSKSLDLLSSRTCVK